MKLARSLVFFIILLSQLPLPFSWADGGNTLDKIQIAGATPGEKQVKAIWQTLAALASPCLDAKSGCGLTSEEASWLKEIIQNLPSELDDLRFVSAQEMPGRFDLSRGLCGRVAVTGSQVGSPIYINQDLIDTTAPRFKPQNWVGLLMHELGHHLGILDTERRPLDAFGAKIQAYFEKNWTQIELTDGSAAGFRLGLFRAPNGGMISPGSGMQLPYLFIWDDEALYRIQFGERAIQQTAICKSGEKYFLDGLENLRWTKEGSWSSAPARRDFSAVMDAHGYCLNSGTHETHQLQGVYFQITGKLQRIPESKGAVRIDPFEITEAITAEPEYNFGNYLTVVETHSNAGILKAGDEWKVSAVLKVRMPLPGKVTGCGANFTSEDFKDGEYNSGRPHAILFDQCLLSPIGPDTYRIDLSYRFAATSPSRKYFLYIFGLSYEGSGEGFADGMPRNRDDVTVEVKNPEPLPQLTLANLLLNTSKGEAHFDHYKNYYSVPKGEKAHLRIEINNGSAILDAHFSGQLFLATSPRRQGSFEGPLGKYPQWSVDMKESHQGSIWAVDYTIAMPEQLGDKLPIMGLKFDRFSIMTQDLRELIIELPQNEFALIFSEYVKN